MEPRPQRIRPTSRSPVQGINIRRAIAALPPGATSVVRTATPNVTRAAAAANPQLFPTRAGLVPGKAPFFASPLIAPRAAPPPLLVTPMEPSMSLLGRIGGALKGAVGGFVTGGPGGAIAGASLGVFAGGARRPGSGSVLAGRAAPLAGCPEGSRGFPPFCFDLFPGGAGSGSGPLVSPGDPRTSRAMIGASAYVPMRRSIDVRRCERGAVLGYDGLCYDKRTIRKDQRAWPPGRKPLLTGGDLNAIAKAARAARRMKVQQRRLEQLGLLKRPKPSRGGSRGVITKAEAARALRS